MTVGLFMINFLPLQVKYVTLALYFTLLSSSTHIKQQGNRRHHTSPSLCTPITPFPANRPHRLRSEFSGFLFALAWHTKWSLLLQHVIGDWLNPFAAKAAATAAAKIANALE